MNPFLDPDQVKDKEKNYYKFTVRYNNESYFKIKFKIHKPKVVECFILERSLKIPGVELIFKSKVLIHPEDVFTCTEGMNKAFTRALEKRGRFIESQIKYIIKDWSKFKDATSQLLTTKMNNFIFKNF